MLDVEPLRWFKSCACMMCSFLDSCNWRVLIRWWVVLDYLSADALCALQAVLKHVHLRYAWCRTASLVQILREHDVFFFRLV